MNKLIGLGGAIVVFFASLIVVTNTFESVDASHILCIQSPVSGKLRWQTTPGVKWQGFGKVTEYKKLSTYDFNVPVRFNDGGHGNLIGSLNYELPVDAEHLSQLHIKYGSQQAIQKSLIETVTNKCVYMTGPLMSSKESYAEKRTNLIRYIEDQIMNGVYRTTQKEMKTKDPMTGADKTVTVVEIVQNGAVPERQEEAVLLTYGIQTSNFAVTSLPYDAEVEKQINEQQGITMKVQTAIASAKEAEQRAITAAKEGEANAAKAKWEQEVIKAKAVTLAQQNKEVAELDAQTAAAEKKANILRGEGEGERKRLVMNADGALDKKLEAIVAINKMYAEAIKDYKGDWVPQIIMGNQDAKAGGSATALVDLLTAKTAREIGVDLGTKGRDNTK